MDTTHDKTYTLKAQDVIGLPVLSLETGEKIDDVDDIIYDPDENRVKALLINPGGIFSDAQVIPIEQVRSIGKDAVVVENASVLLKASAVDKKVSHIAKDNIYLTNSNIITEEGIQLGKVSDLYFEMPTGTVSELEVSQGMKNLGSGKKRIKVSDIITIGKDATMVRAYTVDELQEQTKHQGITGAFHKTKDTFQTGASTVRNQTPSIVDQAKTKFQNIADKTREKSQELYEQSHVKLHEARNDPRNQQRMEQVKQQAQSTLNDLSAKASQFNEKLKQKTTETRATAEQKIEERKEHMDEQQNQNVIGNYLTKNLFTKDGIRVAKRGEVITQQLLEDAELEGIKNQIMENNSSEPIERITASPVKQQPSTASKPVKVSEVISKKEINLSK